jgi:hypothetical protein
MIAEKKGKSNKYAVQNTGNTRNQDFFHAGLEITVTAAAVNPHASAAEYKLIATAGFAIHVYRAPIGCGIAFAIAGIGVGIRSGCLIIIWCIYNIGKCLLIKILESKCYPVGVEVCLE